MRGLLVVVALMALARTSVADPPGPSPKPGPPPSLPAPPTSGASPSAAKAAAKGSLSAEQVADAVLVAVQTKDQPALAALAGKADPDAWLVADTLFARGHPDAAEAFARAAPGADRDRLAGYLATHRGTPDDGAGRARLAAAEAEIARGDGPAALRALTGAPPEDATILGVRIAFARGAALRLALRLEESAAAQSATAGLAERLGWLSQAARAFNEAGLAHQRRGDFRGALAAFESRLRVERARGSLPGAAGALGNVGGAYKALGDYEKALEIDEQALKEKRAAGDRAGAASTLGNIGNVHLELGNPSKALEFFEQSLREKEAIGDRAGVATTLNNIGVAWKAVGNLPRALEFYQRSLEEKEALGDRAGAATTLGNMGVVQAMLGNLAKALQFQERALEVKTALGDRRGAATTRLNLANAHRVLGDPAKALEIYRSVRAETEAVGDRAGAAGALNGMGNAYRMLGEPTKALAAYQQAIDELEALGDPRASAKAVGNLALTYHELGDDRKALELHERALVAKEALGDRVGVASTLGNIGAAHLALGDVPKAIVYLERAVREADRLRATPTLLPHLIDLARARLLSDDPGRALETARRGVALLEPLLGGLAEEQGSDARAQYVDLYGVGALAASRVEEPSEVAFFLESGRAGTLLESLGGRRALRWAAIPEPLRRAEAEARGAEAAAFALYTRSVESQDRAEIQARSIALDRARARVQEVVDRIQREAKREASVFYPHAATLEEIQGWLGSGDALVLYGLCLDEGLAMVVRAREAKVVSLGKASALVAACEAVRAEDRTDDPSAALKALEQALIAPLALGEDVRRVLVSPEGPLCYVPFAPLLGDRTVAYVPSGTTYGLLREERLKKGEGILALGDPDYTSRTDAAALEAYGRERGALLVPLPSTREEARAVGDLVLLGKDASERGVASAFAHARRWHAVHFACHGLVDPERPALSCLALTPDAESDGLLTALEVLEMDLPTDLTVLSACETGKGKVVRGEGIVGLTRAFMFAGAPRVLCSLWKVDDEATRALMVKFYELWSPRGEAGATEAPSKRDEPRGSGLPAAAALRGAQEFVRSQERWKHPYYWAAWVLWGLPE